MRGRGLGTACLRWLEGVCRDQGIRALHLEVDRLRVDRGDTERLADSLQQAFERYYIAISVLVKNGSGTLSAGELESMCQLAAQRLSFRTEQGPHLLCPAIQHQPGLLGNQPQHLPHRLLLLRRRVLRPAVAAARPGNVKEMPGESPAGVGRPQ